MALKTKCQTPGAHFTTKIEPSKIKVYIALPFDLQLTEAQAALLEANIHNVLELCLAPHFSREQS